MNIGQAARGSGVSAKMIRYYERTGLIRPADRTDSNYRSFDDREVNDLRFIKRARTLGFSVDEIVNLLSLWRDRARPSREVKAIAEGHVKDLEVRIAEMQAMADTLRHLSDCCAGDDRPDCPILADLAGGAGEAAGMSVPPPDSRFGR
jgi:MerR family copper efflux transcriptional regulator